MEMPEARQLNGKFTSVVPKHTDVFLTLSQPVEGKSETKGIGSCVHLLYKGRNFIVTCDHVAKERCIYFTNPKGIATPCVPEGQHTLVSGLPLLERSKPHDLAIFDGADLPMEQHGKTRFDLAKSAVVTHALLSDTKHNGLASFIYGVFGEQTSGIVYPDGLAYIEVITYSGLGPIVEVTEDMIVTDHAEKQNLLEGKPLIARIKNIVPTGGYRDISGCSGSGLWIMKTEPILAGILCRPRVANSDKHLIEFTPVWHLLKLLDEILANKPTEGTR